MEEAPGRVRVGTMSVDSLAENHPQRLTLRDSPGKTHSERLIRGDSLLEIHRES